MLCDAVLTREDFTDKVRTMSEEIASANYRQQPIDLKGRLYNQLQDIHGHSARCKRQAAVHAYPQLHRHGGHRRGLSVQHHIRRV